MPSGSSFFSLPFRKKKQRYQINPPEETFGVIYLGNVLTVMARGEDCYEKPLSLIWKAYCTRNRADLAMSLEITRSGLKAETKQQGLTEYWAHRITYSCAPSQYPKVFCWIYKHEGKRLKPELRCHAVLCKKSAEPSGIHIKLQDYLSAALQEYRREKVAIQNARLSGTMHCPRRKLMLHTGSLNFRPPVSRSKSAPRLGSIDEEQEEDEEDALSICYRTNALDTASTASFCSDSSPTSTARHSQDSPPSTSSSVCSTEENERVLMAKLSLETDNISDESGYHDDPKSRELSEEMFYSDSDLIITEEDFEEEEELVTSL